MNSACPDEPPGSPATCYSLNGEADADTIVLTSMGVTSEPRRRFSLPLVGAVLATVAVPVFELERSEYPVQRRHPAHTG